MGRVISRITANQILTAFVVFVLASTAVTLATYFLYDYDQDFGENILVEAHGMLFDILVIGIFILWLNKQGEKHLEITRYQEEIDDFRGWESDEASHRIKGNITRLNRNGVTNIDLFGCFLAGANLVSATLSSARLTDATLTNADLTFADLSSANLTRADLSGARLTRADLSNATLTNADLSGATLVGVNLTGADLSGARLSGAVMFDVVLRGVQFLTVEQLCEAETLHRLIGLVPDLMEQIKEQCPHLLEEPKDD